MPTLTDRVCHHERLRPTDWNQSKPEPCKMVAHTVPRGYVEWYCPICDWGWSAPDEPEQAMTRAIEKAAQAVFGKETIDAG